ncbi:MAG: hypothetical protein DRJ64_02025 [Thermoprotei archaeon]|nr:MAG: hypothetical protein DRJ64_02025 [Thermoprotei archaeon]
MQVRCIYAFITSGEQHGQVYTYLGKVMETVQKAVQVELNSDLFLTWADLPSLVQKVFAAVGLRPPPKVQPPP